MEIVFEKDCWTSGSARAATEPGNRHPEWRVLAMRLKAARQAWQVLRFDAANGAEGRTACPGRGSFHQQATKHILRLEQSFLPVNQVDSAHRNCGQGNVLTLVGESNTGGRG